MKDFWECVMGALMGAGTGACLALVLLGVDRGRPLLVGFGVLVGVAVVVLMALWI
jgi:hypothetical protein